MDLSIAKVKFSCNYSFSKFLADFIENESHDQEIPQLQISNIVQDEYAEPSLSRHNDIDWEYVDGKLVMTNFEADTNQVISKVEFDQNCESARITYFKSDFEENLFHINLMAFVYFQIRLLNSNSISLHSAAIDYNGMGILFSAPSGTGKSTQANLWVKHMGAQMINGDRPGLTIVDNQVYVHGTPWSGSDPIITNISRPVKAIVMIEQSEMNEIYKLEPHESINLLLPRIFLTYQSEAIMDLALKTVEKIILNTPIFKLKCRPDFDSVQILNEQISLL